MQTFQHLTTKVSGPKITSWGRWWDERSEASPRAAESPLAATNGRLKTELEVSLIGVMGTEPEHGRTSSPHNDELVLSQKLRLWVCQLHSSIKERCTAG